MPLLLDPATEDEIARVLATRLKRLADGPLDHTGTWESLCTSLNLRSFLFEVAGGGRGEFCPSTNPDWNGTGVIAINTSYPELEQCRAWVHELAHAELHRWHPPQLDEAKDSWMYEGDVDSIHHRIARNVEFLVLGDFFEGTK